MKRLFAALFALCLLLSGCVLGGEPKETRYSYTFLNCFDTVTTVLGYRENEEVFLQEIKKIEADLQRYHQLFDIYNVYPGVTNLKTVNDQAAIAPVQVDKEIIALLQDCKQYCTATNGKVNAAMGTVLQLWHEARDQGIHDPQNARLPDMQALEAAAQHINFDHVILDETANTVFFADPDLKLDVGAIAKGWATQRVAEKAPQGLLISVGGNVCATGAKRADGTAWVVGIQDPDSDKYLHTLNVTGGCVVTSGDYQRAYMVQGQLYHHIIDPQTLMPARYWRSVTVVCDDSGLADALSTALFLLPLEEGRELLGRFGAEAMWLDAQGQEYFSSNFAKLLKN